MHHPGRTPRAGTALLVLLLSAIGCETTNTAALGDGAQKDDLATGGPQDLSGVPRDLSMNGQQDLKGQQDLSSPQDLSAIQCGNGNTFTKVRNQVFSMSCLAGEGPCHSSAFKAGSMDLTLTDPDTDLVNIPASIAPSKVRVKPGDPADSFLWQKLNNLQGPTEGAPMPTGLVKWMPLPSNELDLVYCWILQGAKDN